MGRLPRLPLTNFECAGVSGHQTSSSNHLAYCNPETDHQQRSYGIVHEHHTPPVSRVDRLNFALSDALHHAPKFRRWRLGAGYITAATIRQGVKADADAKVLKAKRSLNWTGPYKPLQLAAPAPATRPTVHLSALSSSIWICPRTCPARMPTAKSLWRAASPVPTRHDSKHMPKKLPAGLTQPILCQQLHQGKLPVSIHIGRRFGAPPTT